MRCVWIEAGKGGKRLGAPSEAALEPLDHRLRQHSSWLRVIEGTHATAKPGRVVWTSPLDRAHDGYLAETVRGIQDAVAAPLCFDYPDRNLQEICFKDYDRARSRPALVNSLTEQRWEIMDLYKNYGPFKVIVMASECMEDGVAKQNKSADEIASTAKRAAQRLQSEYGLAFDDIYIHISVSAVVADTKGLHKATLDAVHRLLTDRELKGLHIVGGLTNIGQQLAPEAADGSDLKLALECAFLTLAVPLGFDSILCTPWRQYQPLPPDNYVLNAYRNILEQTGSNALRAVRKFYRRQAAQVA
jgi:hypothetical protein